MLGHATKKLFLVVSQDQAGANMLIVAEHSLHPWQSARHFSRWCCFEINRLPNLSARRWFNECSFGERC